MTEHFGDDLWVDALREKERRAGMPEVVEPSARWLDTYWKWLTHPRLLTGFTLRYKPDP
jgi:hypothetical protein